MPLVHMPGENCPHEVPNWVETKVLCGLPTVYAEPITLRRAAV
jgi:hypothetical protein